MKEFCSLALWLKVYFHVNFRRNYVQSLFVTESVLICQRFTLHNSITLIAKSASSIVSLYSWKANKENPAPVVPPGMTSCFP